MGGPREKNVTVPSLPPPKPKAPLDLYRKRRDLAKVQMLEREISYLEEELKSVGLQQASNACKEVADFVSGIPDPMIPNTTTKETRRSCNLWKWLRGLSSFINALWICSCSRRITRKCPSFSKCCSHKLYACSYTCDKSCCYHCCLC